MATSQIIAFVEVGIPGAGSLGNEVGAQLGGIPAERSADDLLHFSLVEVNARSEHLNRPERVWVPEKKTKAR